MPQVVVVLTRIPCGDDKNTWSWLSFSFSYSSSAIALIVNEAPHLFPVLVVQVHNVSECLIKSHAITGFSLFLLIDL